MASVIPASVILAAGIFSGAVSAQDTDEIKVETSLVNLGVSVLDRSGNNVAGLTKDKFSVFDNGRKQEVVLFSDEGAPVTYGFVYDLHPTTSERTRLVLNSIREFTAGLKGSDDFFAVVFNERGSLILDFVPTEEQISRHLSLDERGEPNSLYDAIVAAAEKAEERQTTKKTLIIISDGKDDGSHHSYSALSGRLRGLNIQVFAVFLGDKQEFSYSDITRERRPRELDRNLSLDRAALEELARGSGGNAQEPFSEDVINLHAVYSRIAKEMRSQYSLGFYPTVQDGKWHKLKVTVEARPGGKSPKLAYRGGYQSPKPQ